MAPQIRVILAEPVQSALSPEAVGASAEPVDLPAVQTLPVLALSTGWSQALRPCALAAMVVLILMLLGLSPIVAMPSAGFLAVVFSRQGSSGMLIKTGSAARLGAFAGLLCFGVMAGLISLAATVPAKRAEFHDEILKNAEKWASSRPNDADIQAAIAQLRTHEGFMTALVVGGVMLFVASIALGALGAAFGAAIFGRRRQG